MAERRMFAKSIVDSDIFLDMPLSTQCLYFHLGMRADDDGFLNNPKKILRMIGCSEDELKMLIAKGFIIPFPSGVVVLTHWKMHNYIRSDRYKPTIYVAEKALLQIVSGGTYQLVDNADTNGIPDNNQTVYQMDTQVRLGKDRLGKDRLGYISAPTSDKSEPEPEATEPIFIELILNTGQMYPVTQRQVDNWKQLYPGVDIEQALRSMAGWLEGNPTKRKTKRGIVRFVTSWLDRDQNSGKNPRKGGVNNGTSSNTSSVWDAGTV